jgi:hypothetical protein
MTASACSRVGAAIPHSANIENKYRTCCRCVWRCKLLHQFVQNQFHGADPLPSWTATLAMLRVHTKLFAAYKLSSFHPQNRRDEQGRFLCVFWSSGMQLWHRTVKETHHWWRQLPTRHDLKHVSPHLVVVSLACLSPGLGNGVINDFLHCHCRKAEASWSRYAVVAIAIPVDQLGLGGLRSLSCFSIAYRRTSTYSSWSWGVRCAMRFQDWYHL